MAPRSATTALVLVLTSTLLTAVLSAGQDWKKADIETVRLKPSAFPSLPAPVRRELERRACLVPQTSDSNGSENVVRGRFTSATQTDIAVLCSRQRVSSILVFRGGSATAVVELAKRPDRDFLQGLAEGLIGYSRVLGAASPKYILDHHQAYGGPTPPRLDHDGINDIFSGKASVVWYWSGGKWLQLQGAN